MFLLSREATGHQGCRRFPPEDCRAVPLVIESHRHISRLDVAGVKLFGDRQLRTRQRCRRPFNNFQNVRLGVLMAPTGEADRWQQIEEVFLAALDLPGDQRATYLDSACDDDAMRLEVERMLQADSHEDVFLDRPVASLEEAFAPLSTPTEILAPSVTSLPTSPQTMPLDELMTPPAPPRNDPMLVAGNLLCDRFRVIEFLAAGGMGEVYKVEDLELGGYVAIKILRPDLTEDIASMERFRREVQLARRVTHPSVCRSFDIFRHHFADNELLDNPLSPTSLTFLSMELLQGETLTHRLLRDGLLEPKQALPIIQQIAAGLEAAHREGIVHRDLKSSNVFLVPGEAGRQRAVITDFGLARLGSHHDAARRPSVTRSGVTLGTPAYMAPEQIKGEKITPTTDIYALGVLIYEMVTGRFPFEGEDSLVTAIRRLHEDPTPPRQYVEDLDPQWEDAILRCLQREPIDRFQNAADLASFLAGDKTAEHAPWRQADSGLKWAAAGFGALLVLVFIAWGLRSSFGPQTPGPPSTLISKDRPTRTAVAVLGFQNLTGRQENAWLSTALAEMLTMELAASQTLRTLSGEHVSRMRLELELPETTSFAEDTLSRIHRYSGADLVVLGTYFTSAGELRLDLRLVNTVSGEHLLLIKELGQESELPELVTRIGQSLRNSLGLVSPSAADSLKRALPKDPEAARLYHEGLDKLRLFEVLGAHQNFVEATRLAADSPSVYTALAESLSALGRDSEAALAARRAFELAGELPKHEQLRIEGQLRQTTGEWVKAAEIFSALHQTYPDDIESGLQLARIQTTAGRGSDALITLERLNRLPGPTNLGGRIALEEAIAAESLADYRHSYEAAMRSAQISDQQGARWLAARARWRAAHSLWRQGTLDEAEEVAQQAESTLGELGDRAGRADALNLLANIHEHRGELAEAKTLYEAALAEHRELGNRAGETKVLNNLAYLMFRLQDEAAAELLYDEALTVARSVDRKTDVARSLHNLAILRRRQNRLQEAEELFVQALAISREIGDRGIQATSLTNLGIVLRAGNNLRSALERYEESLELSRQIGDQRGILGSLNNLGIVLDRLGRLSEAKGRLEESSILCRQLGDSQNLARRLVNLSNLNRRLGDLENAESHLWEADALYDELEDIAGKASVHASRAELWLVRGDYDKARSELQEAIATRRRLHQQPRVLSLSVNQAALALATGGADEAIALLRPAIAALNSQDNLLQANSLLARSLLAADQVIDAKKTLEAARVLRENSDDLEKNLFYDLTQGELALRQGRWDAADAVITAALKQATESEFFALGLELQLLRTDLQRARGETDLARRAVLAVQQQAEAAGYGHLARLAGQRL